MFYFFGEVELILQEHSLSACHVCGRTFLPQPLKKHIKVCEKNAVKKRKPFDSLKQRVEGTDLAQFHQKTYLKKQEPEPVKSSKPSRWKETHMELVTAIRAAKGVPEEKTFTSPSSKSKSTTSLMSSNERCPSCDRQFGPKAFDRHVEWCKERKARIHQSPANVLVAKERLEARIKYKVPPLNKPKKLLVKEKYANGNANSESASITSLASPTVSSSLSRGPSVRKPKSLMGLQNGKEKTKNDHSNGDKILRDRPPEIIGTPSPKAESIRSSHIKRSVPSTKLNSTSVNSQVDGMIVSSLKSRDSSTKLVTWKDTVQKKVNEKLRKETNSAKQIKRKNMSLIVIKESSNNNIESPRKNSLSEAEINKRKVFEEIKSEIPIFKSKLMKTGIFKKCNETITSTVDKRLLPNSSRALISEESDPSIAITSSITDSENNQNSSCNSVTKALDNLTIHSKLSLESEEQNNYSDECEKVCSETKVAQDKIEELDISVEDPAIEDVEKNKLLLKDDFTSFSNWFDSYSKEFNDLETNENGVKISDSIILSDDFQKLRITSSSSLNNKNKNRSPKNQNNEDRDVSEVNADKRDVSVDEDSLLSERTEILEPNLSTDDECTENKGTSENLICLFQSTTGINLTRENSLNCIPDEKSWAAKSKTEVTSLEDLSQKYSEVFESYTEKTSNYSLKKSYSDLNVYMSKSTIVSIFLNQNKSNDCESLELYELGVTNSLPNLNLSRYQQKGTSLEESFNDLRSEGRISGNSECKSSKEMKMNVSTSEEFEVASTSITEKQRQEIIKIATEQFITDFNEKTNDNYMVKLNEEYYSVPKKKRRLYQSDDSVSSLVKSTVETLNNKIEPKRYKVKPRSKFSRNTRQNKTSSINFTSIQIEEPRPDTSTVCKVTPRTLTLLDTVLNINSEMNVTLTKSDCRKLLEIDKGQIPQIEKLLNRRKIEVKLPMKPANEYEKSEANNNIKCEGDTLKLPPIKVKNTVNSDRKKLEDTNTSTRGNDCHLPKIIHRFHSQNPTNDNSSAKDVDTTWEHRSVNRKSPSPTVEKKKNLHSLKRSMTLFDPNPKPPSLKNKEDVKNYFSGQEQKMERAFAKAESGDWQQEEMLKPEELFAVDDQMYEEYKKYEEMYLREKEDHKSRTRKNKTKNLDLNYGVFTASEEEDLVLQNNNKLSNDSAYGSLTRKTPKHRNRTTKLVPLEQKQTESTSSSGSENGPGSPAPSLPMNLVSSHRTSKFCHECGTRFPVTTAKFCVECGVKRLIL